ncbi:hypothetical protein PsorP6_001560 [Peronosclerospora sorghi]|uniref:Uncharacterized protein n=1 Tax=Peronosclerospora sorghi TaxID=230839 RepID=A0ACC0WPW9_9STRA|nr:hypothetical protein PsorP6_001560 [Peronosclerospora sorghi]
MAMEARLTRLFGLKRFWKLKHQISREFDVEIRAGKFKVGLRVGETFVDGRLNKKVKVDDRFLDTRSWQSLWRLPAKYNQMEWWKTTVQGDAEIDTQKVQPENSKLADLDSDTRLAVGMMIFYSVKKQHLSICRNRNLCKSSWHIIRR